MNEKLKRIVEGLVGVYSSRLAQVSLDYLNIGMQQFHKRRHSDWMHYQVALGNLSIAIELMIKAFLSSRNFPVVFQGGPSEFKIMFTSPQELPSSFNWRVYWDMLRSNSIETIGIDKAIAALYVFRPDLKPSLHPHSRFLSTIRNPSVHATLPDYQRYDLDRIAFLALSILKSLEEVSSFKYAWGRLPIESTTFFQKFEEARITKVEKSIEQAKQKYAKGQPSTLHIYPEGWEEYSTKCPVCGSDAFSLGYTEFRVDAGEDGPEESLTFNSDNLNCDTCGLSLDDSDELLLAGVHPSIDRSDDIGHWLWEQGNLDE